HFSGHGSTREEILFTDADENAYPVTGQKLQNLFRAIHDNLKCVVLNACYSETLAQAIAEVVDVVIGMSATIEDRAAIRFASAFYQTLGHGKNFQTAFDAGCAELDLHSLQDTDRPQLLPRAAIKPEEIWLLPARTEQTPMRSPENVSVAAYSPEPDGMRLPESECIEAYKALMRRL